ncbi:MAG: ATP-binding protein [Rhodospirillaceae bacterium]
MAGIGAGLVLALLVRHRTAHIEIHTPEAVFIVGVVVTIMLVILLRQYGVLRDKDAVLDQTAGDLQSSRAAASAYMAHIETVYSIAPIGLCMFDLALRYVFVNERMARIYEKSPAELIGHTIGEVNPPMGERLRPFLDYVLAMGGALENVEILEDVALQDMESGGASPPSHRAWLCSFHPAHDADGAVTGIVSAMLDVTNLKEAEQEKSDLAAQLFLAQKTEALGRLTGGIAHDFNNMLGVILGGLEFIKDTLPENPQIKSYVDRIELAAEHSTDLIRRLLAFARQQPLVPRDIRVGDTIVNLAPLLENSIDRNVEIRFVTAPDTWIARVDESQLGSALLNLVINARDAMPNGGKITIEVGNAVLDESYSAEDVEVYPGEYVSLAVSDTGTGMSPETIPRVFEPFFTTKEAGRGSGLGLSMVFGFVKQSGGHIKIYSELGHGTVVKLYLPRGVDDLPVAARSDAETAIRGGERILLVEDDALVRETATRQLESLGYSVVQAANGAEALHILKDDGGFDLLFTDVVMPGGMNGPAVAKSAVEMYPSLKVLFVSGYTNNAVIDHGWLPAGVHILQKPYRRAELAAKVRRVLAAGGAGNAP